MISCGKIKLRVNPRKKVLFREYHPRHSRLLNLDLTVQVFFFKITTKKYAIKTILQGNITL